MEGLVQIIIKVEDERGVKLATYDSRVEGTPLKAAEKARAHLNRKWPAPAPPAPPKKAKPRKKKTVAKKAKKVVRKLKRR